MPQIIQNMFKYWICQWCVKYRSKCLRHRFIHTQSDTCGFSSTNDSTDRRPYIVSNCCNEFLNVLALTALQQFRATILRFINEYSTQNINTLWIEIFRKSPSFGIFLSFIQFGCDDKFNLPNRNRLNRSVIFNLKSRYESPIQSRLKLIHIFGGCFATLRRIESY